MTSPLIQFPRILIQILALAASLLFAVTIAAQDLDNVTISGKVTDQNDAVIPGASVTATLVATKVDRVTVTDDNGNYKLIQLSPGTYDLKATAASFQQKALPNLNFIAGRNA